MMAEQDDEETKARQRLSKVWEYFAHDKRKKKVSVKPSGVAIPLQHHCDARASGAQAPWSTVA